MKSTLKLGFGNTGAWIGLVFSICFMGSIGLTNMIGSAVVVNMGETIYSIGTMAIMSP